MANESIMSVPVNFKDLKDVQIFFGRLIVALDKLLGKRASDPAALTSELQTSQNNTATSLADLDTSLRSYTDDAEADANVYADNAASTAETNAAAYTDTAEVDANNYTDTKISDLLQAPIADLSYTGFSVSASYDQTEVQQIITDLTSIANKVDSLLGELRLAGIIGP